MSTLLCPLNSHNQKILLHRSGMNETCSASMHGVFLVLSKGFEQCPKRVMMYYVLSCCLRHSLRKRYTTHVLASATNVEVLPTPLAYDA